MKDGAIIHVKVARKRALRNYVRIPGRRGFYFLPHFSHVLWKRNKIGKQSKIYAPGIMKRGV